jgi:hypothetical protein
MVPAKPIFREESRECPFSIRLVPQVWRGSPGGHRAALYPLSNEHADETVHLPGLLTLGDGFGWGCTSATMCGIRLLCDVYQELEKCD